MNLKAKINGIEYDIVQGATFSEEYNETLDSGSIIIAHVSKIEDLRPYDDVFVYTGEFHGYPFSDSNPEPEFYKHLLVDQFTEEFVNLDNAIYNYKIELMSETKKLEVIQLPNISVTEPLLYEDKITVAEYIKRFVNMYSPKYKKVSDANEQTWEYVQKYTIYENEINEIFGNVFSPDFSMNNPSLKDLLSRFATVKDCIPYVKDDVIHFLDISKTHGSFNVDKRYVNTVVGSRSSANHCDALKRQYTNALGQKNCTKFTEFLGFRNSDTALMTIENMRLEFSHPIYRINSIKMCYYKKIKATSDGSTKDYSYIVKQDITPLVRLNAERNVISQDWTDLTSDNFPTSIEKLQKYKFATVGYDIGSQYILDWGSKYTYPTGPSGFTYWDTTKSYIENIFNFFDRTIPFGEDGIEGVRKKGNFSDITAMEHVNPFSTKPLFFKALFFEVEYIGFYNGTIIYGKDDFKDDIVNNDNSSSSLTLLNGDGIFEKAKINRFGNKALQINARYNNVNQIQELGSIYNADNENDVIIYHREYSIFDNFINCAYYGTKNYVLKNYFTSVFAKYRTWALMDYNESVCRAENRKMSLLMSKDKSYYETNNVFDFKRFASDNNYLKAFFSCFDESDENLKLNYGFIKYDTDDIYVADITATNSDDILLLNIKMNDNISAGVYISVAEPTYDSTVQDDYKGSQQKYYIAADPNTGFIKNMSFCFAHINTKDYFLNEIFEYDEGNIKKIYKEKLFTLPKIELSSESENAVKIFYARWDNPNEIKKDIIVLKIKEDSYTEFLNNPNFENYNSECIYATPFGEDLSLTSGHRIVFKDIDSYSDNYIKIKSEIKTTAYLSLYGKIEPYNYEAIITFHKDGSSQDFDFYEKPLFLNHEEGFKYFSAIIETVKVRKHNNPNEIIEINSNYGTPENKIWNNNIYNVQITNYTVDSYSNAIINRIFPGYNETNIRFSKVDYKFPIYPFTNQILYSSQINKDNKEYIDMTFEFEPFSDKNVFKSGWFSRLNNFINPYNKSNSHNLVEKDIVSSSDVSIFYQRMHFNNVSFINELLDVFVLKIKTEVLNDFLSGVSELNTEYLSFLNEQEGTVYGHAIKLNKIKSYNNNSITITVNIQTYCWYASDKNTYYPYTYEGDLVFYKDLDLNVEDRSEYNFYEKPLFMKHENGYTYFSGIVYELKALNATTQRGVVDVVSIRDIDTRPTETTAVWSTIQSNVEYSSPTEYGNAIVYEIGSYSSGFSQNFFKKSGYSYSLSQNIFYPKSMYLVSSIEYLDNLTLQNQYPLKTWNINTDYNKDEIVWYDSKKYKCIEDHASSEEFDTSKWEELGNEIVQGLSVIDKDVNKVFLYTTENDLPCIKVNLTGLSAETQSIQYWFLEEDTLNFVFGVNISAEDREKGEILIYVSALSTKDQRVYNDKHEVVGMIYNYVKDNDDDKVYGEEQYYKEIE